MFINLYTAVSSIQLFRNNRRSARTEKWVKDKIILVRL